MVAIETNGLTKSFGRLLAVSGLNLHVAEGTIFGFLGPNGSGKSTTVKLLTGLLQPAGAGLYDVGQLPLGESSFSNAVLSFFFRRLPD
jgi:ABC-type multidrug transport system ATPase subunit